MFNSITNKKEIHVLGKTKKKIQKMNEKLNTYFHIRNIHRFQSYRSICMEPIKRDKTKINRNERK